MIAIIFAAMVATAFSIVLTPLFAKAFRNLNLGQFVRADTPTTHEVKRGTPSMGGLVFILAAVIGYFIAKLVAGEPPTLTALLVIFMMVGQAAVGFLDDFLKVKLQNSLGLNAWFKILGQLIVGTIFAILALTLEDDQGRTPASSAISLFRDIEWLDLSDFGNTIAAQIATWGIWDYATLATVIGIILVIAWQVLITTSTTNAVNVTDGLDGLAGGASLFAIGSYIIIGYWQFNQSCFNPSLDQEVLYKCYEVTAPLDLAVIAAAIAGALLGFLWWNTSPAQIMMGDTGSFGLGGALAALAILSQTELLLIFIGGLFVWIASTVIIQKIYFKTTKRFSADKKGKRIWLSTPIHHHYELKGWQEVTIVVRFWIIQGLLVSVGVGLFYLEWTYR